MLNKEPSPRRATSRANFWIPRTFSFLHQTVPRGYGALEEASVITKQKAIIFWIQRFCKISSSERARIIPRRSIISTQVDQKKNLRVYRITPQDLLLLNKKWKKQEKSTLKLSKLKIMSPFILLPNPESSLKKEGANSTNYLMILVTCIDWDKFITTNNWSTDLP